MKIIGWIIKAQLQLTANYCATALKLDNILAWNTVLVAEFQAPMARFIKAIPLHPLYFKEGISPSWTL